MTGRRRIRTCKEVHSPRQWVNNPGILSVKALTQFQSVLQNPAKNLVWTFSLGQALQNQQIRRDGGVQYMRAKAQAGER